MRLNEYGLWVGCRTIPSPMMVKSSLENTTYVNIRGLFDLIKVARSAVFELLINGVVVATLYVYYDDLPRERMATIYKLIELGIKGAHDIRYKEQLINFLKNDFDNMWSCI
jgi:hypothetical protein